ncbi:MAG: M64 family metallo-endopeptidase [Planctomycetota bacterium]|nr:M64 family metallo-endopeptidase [Planctomycetota bacterium]
MRHVLAIPLLLAACSTTSVPTGSAGPAARLDARFTGATLRFEYDHVGTAAEEHIAPHGFRVEGPWAGSSTQLEDPTGFGLYRFTVRDRDSGGLLWSRGFSSIYGEWETTGPAKTSWRSFQESQRFPEPRAPAALTLEKRGGDGAFREIWRGEVDPASRFVDRAPIPREGRVIDLHVQGDPSTQVDLLLLAEGYAEGREAKFEADARRLVDALFATEPWKSRRADVSVRALFVPSSGPGPGISNPRKGIWRDSALGCSFNAFDSDRYVLTYEDRRLREVAAQAPYDALALVIDERKYGGGGIYGLWSTVTADTEPAGYVFVHELGHSFAGLADEYYTSQVAYETLQAPGTEPWEPNATALLDPRRLKWGDLVESGTPVPTPWRQAEYDKNDLAYQARRQELIAAGATEEQNEALMRSVRETSGPFLRAEPWFGRTGAFEGSSYVAKGLYRPQADCIMFTRNPVPFCAVCRRALDRAIDLYTR